MSVDDGTTNENLRLGHDDCVWRAFLPCVNGEEPKGLNDEEKVGSKKDVRESGVAALYVLQAADRYAEEKKRR